MKTLYHFFIFLFTSLMITACGGSSSSVAPEGTITFKVNGVSKTFKQYYPGANNVSADKKLVTLVAYELGSFPSYVITLSISNVGSVQPGTYLPYSAKNDKVSVVISYDYYDKNQNLQLQYANLADETVNSAILVVTTFSKTRIEGTFQGNISNPRNKNDILTLTEGKFSLPIE